MADDMERKPHLSASPDRDKQETKLHKPGYNKSLDFNAEEEKKRREREERERNKKG